MNKFEAQDGPQRVGYPPAEGPPEQRVGDEQRSGKHESPAKTMTGKQGGEVSHPANKTTAFHSRLAAGAAVLISAGVVTIGITIFRRQSDPVYLVETSDLILALIAAGLAFVGLTSMLIAGRPDITLLAGLVTGLLVAGFAALLSIGVRLILVAIILLWLLVKRLDQGTNWLPMLSGAGVGAGLLILASIALQAPLAACDEDGATVNVDGRYDSVSASANRGDDFEVGWVEFNGSRIDYECRQGELIRFEKIKNTG